MGNSGQPCSAHEISNCAICYPPPNKYRKGIVDLDVPPGHHVQILPGTGTYHQPDCALAAGEWDGAEMAKKLGQRIARSPDEIVQLDLRPASGVSRK